MQFDQLKRRDFITLVGGAAAWPLAASAQRRLNPLIGFLAGPTAAEAQPVLRGFREGLRQTGFAEGQNVEIAFRWAEGQYARYPKLAAELVNLQVSAIAALGAPAALAVAPLTKTIPITFISSADPVALGLVASLNRPGGNVTGIAFLDSELVRKQFELLHEMLPRTSVLGLIVNPRSPNTETQLRNVPVAMKALGVEIVIENASADRDLDGAFASLVQQQVGGLVIPSEAFFYGLRKRLIELAARHSLPAIYYDREYVADGGLMSYGTSVADAYRLAGVYTGRILKGDNPADLPVQQAVKTAFTVNLKTANSLKLELPLSLLVRIDETIE